MPMHCCFEPNAMSGSGGSVSVAAPIVGSGSPSDPIDYRWTFEDLSSYPATLSAWVGYTTDDTPGTCVLPASPIESDMVAVSVPKTATNNATLSSVPNTFEGGVSTWELVPGENATFSWTGAVWIQTS